MSYDINFIKLITFLLPSYKRKTKRVSWLYRLLKHHRTMHNEFIAHNSAVDTDLKHSPGYKIQVEQMLIDNFGEGITITNNLQTVRPFFAYDTDDPRNQHAFGINNNQNYYAYDTDAYNFDHKNFTVRVPAGLFADIDRMSAMIKRFNTRGMNFEIIEI